MEINSIDELVKLAGLVKQQELATEAEVEEDCGCADEPQPVMTNNPNMYAILQRLAQMGEVHEDEVTEEWANSTEHFDGEDRITDLPKGEPVDTSLRRHLGANAQPVRVEEGIKDHTVEDMMEAYNAFKTDAIAEETVMEAKCDCCGNDPCDCADDCSCKMNENAEITEMDDTDSGDWSFTTTDGHKVVDQIDPADGDKYDQYHVSTPVGDIYAYYDPSYDEDGGDFVEFDSENPEVKRMLPQSAKKDELNGIINKIVDTVAGGKADVEEDNAFNTAAANAKKAGKSEFEFNGKKYKVKMDAKTADALTDDIDMLRKLAGM